MAWKIFKSLSVNPNPLLFLIKSISTKLFWFRKDQFYTHELINSNFQNVIKWQSLSWWSSSHEEVVFILTKRNTLVYTKTNLWLIQTIRYMLGCNNVTLKLSQWIAQMMVIKCHKKLNIPHWTLISFKIRWSKPNLKIGIRVKVMNLSHMNIILGE